MHFDNFKNVRKKSKCVYFYMRGALHIQTNCVVNKSYRLLATFYPMTVLLVSSLLPNEFSLYLWAQVVIYTFETT